jgi:hypothetical protein
LCQEICLGICKQAAEVSQLGNGQQAEGDASWCYCFSVWFENYAKAWCVFAYLLTAAGPSFDASYEDIRVHFSDLPTAV